MPDVPRERPRGSVLGVAGQILALSLGTGVLAYLATFLLASKYESYATYYFPLTGNPSSSLLQLGGATSADRGSVGGFNGALPSPLIGSAPQTAIGIFSSRTCRALVRQDLVKQGYSADELTDKAVNEMTEAKLDRNGMVRLEVDSRDPKLSRAMVTAYQKAFESIAQKLTLNVSHRNRVLIEQRLKTLNERADQLDRQTLEAVANPNSIDLDLAKDTLLEAEKQVIEASQKRAGVEAKLRSMVITLGRYYDAQSKQPSIGPSDNKSPLVEALEKRRLAFEDARKAFQPGSAEFQNAERDYVTASKLLQGLAKDRQALASAGIDPQSVEAVSDYAAMRAAERELTRQIGKLKQRANSSAANPYTIDGLKAELAQTRKTISQLDSEYQLALIAEARDPSRFEVLDQPVTDYRPVFPRRLLIAALAAALVFALLAGRLAMRAIRRQEASLN